MKCWMLDEDGFAMVVYAGFGSSNRTKEKIGQIIVKIKTTLTKRWWPILRLLLF